MSRSTRESERSMLGVASVTAGEREGGEQARHAVVEDGEVLPAGLVAEGAGEPAFADAAGPGDQQITPCADPVAGGELEEQRAIETAGSAEVDVLDAGLMAQPRRPGAASRSAFGVAASPRGRAAGRAIRHVRGSRASGVASSVLEALGHAVEAEGVQKIEGRVGRAWMVSVSGSSRGRERWDGRSPSRSRSGGNADRDCWRGWKRCSCS